MNKDVGSIALARFKERMVDLIDAKIEDAKASITAGEIATIGDEEIKSLFRKDNSK